MLCYNKYPETVTVTVTLVEALKVLQAAFLSSVTSAPEELHSAQVISLFWLDYNIYSDIITVTASLFGTIRSTTSAIFDSHDDTLKPECAIPDGLAEQTLPASHPVCNGRPAVTAPVNVYQGCHLGWRVLL